MINLPELLPESQGWAHFHHEGEVRSIYKYTSTSLVGVTILKDGQTLPNTTITSSKTYTALHHLPVALKRLRVRAKRHGVPCKKVDGCYKAVRFLDEETRYWYKGLVFEGYTLYTRDE